MTKQYTRRLMMVRPASFSFNAETALSNAFQQSIGGYTAAEIQQKAEAEFDSFVAILRSNGVEVLVVQDTATPSKPDAVFPNNWISMQADGTIYLYPMCTPNRRLERREDIIDLLEEKFAVKKVVDLSAAEASGLFLEGTGSIIFDHPNRKAYACISPRTDRGLLEAHCAQLQYDAIAFDSTDRHGKAVYHTNVMLTIGDQFAVICLESIRNEQEKQMVVDSLTATGLEIVAISEAQMNCFAGNMLQVENAEGKTFLVMSQSAFDSLTSEQRTQLEQYTTLLPVAIPTIETIGGGSARCMLAEIFLPERQ
ncbi:MAG TPA: arginine deiminase-related protein [Chitinophagales bacterium]|nr:arginine deiminase-related protein [Chitinophagales bacterium]HQO88834.1 arginine deiminase-related protein [Chitinophagales bacterium]